MRRARAPEASETPTPQPSAWTASPNGRRLESARRTHVSIGDVARKLDPRQCAALGRVLTGGTDSINSLHPIVKYQRARVYDIQVFLAYTVRRFESARRTHVTIGDVARKLDPRQCAALALRRRRRRRRRSLQHGRHRLMADVSRAHGGLQQGSIVVLQRI